uniref:Uncharacterized protein n=1 Tax=Oryza glumipatula TaxID=40148 RepID=A0A0D9YWQ5_9ORYZ
MKMVGESGGGSGDDLLSIPLFRFGHQLNPVHLSLWRRPPSPAAATTSSPPPLFQCWAGKGAGGGWSGCCSGEHDGDESGRGWRWWAH